MREWLRVVDGGLAMWKCDAIALASYASASKQYPFACKRQLVVLWDGFLSFFGTSATRINFTNSRILTVPYSFNRDINKVDQTMDDIRDQMDLANEISDAISQPVNFGVEFDEEELNDELEQLEQEELDAKLLDTGASGVGELPEVPDFAVPGTLQVSRLYKEYPPKRGFVFPCLLM